MSNYTPITDFAAKDALSPGDPLKKAQGTHVSAELAAIATAITSKEDTANKGQNNGYAGLDANGLLAAADLPDASESAEGIVELATTAEVVTGTDTARAVTPAGVEAWGAQNAGIVQDLSNLSDPGVDQVFGWDESANAGIGFTLGTGLGTLDTAIVLADDLAGLEALSSTGFVTRTASNTYANRSFSEGFGIDITNGDGISGNVTIAVDPAEITSGILESAITDSTILARVGSTETISGAWTFSSRPKFTSAGGFLSNASSSNTGGKVTVTRSVPANAAAVGSAGDMTFVY